MAGKIVIGDAEAGEPKPDGPVLQPQWDRFTVHFADGGALILRDKRRLGRAVLDPVIDHLGPDAARGLARRRSASASAAAAAPLKARIMDQSVIAGVGNLLADEALWQARLSPRPPGRRPRRRPSSTACATRSARPPASALRSGGVHTGEVIPHRRRDGVCPRCGAAMARATVGGRTTYWCPAEQV